MLCVALRVTVRRAVQKSGQEPGLMNMDEGDTLVRRRSRRSTAGNR
jgi:hypothetical protein